MSHDRDDVENTTDNPRSWTAWKNEAERLQRIIEEMQTKYAFSSDMKPITEQDNAQLKAFARIEISRYKNSPEKQYMVELMEIALASLTAVPVKTKLKYSSVLPKFIGETSEVESLHCFIHGDTPDFPTQEEAYSEACNMAGDLYTAPPVPVIRLPDEIEGIEHSEYGSGRKDGWNLCLDEIKRLNGLGE